jgi:DNA polymerase elongation subunit (family B)
MATLVFDIETSALPLDSFDATQQEFLFREAERIVDPEERATRRCEIQRLLSLWPLTARIVCIAMINPHSGGGQVLFTSEEHDEQPASGPIKFQSCTEESDLLASFWNAARHYDSIVTFNGRGFDVPFLYMRSALLNVPISRKEWLGYRYSTEPHCDLAEQLTFYGVSGRDGATRRFNLDFYCKSFGIESPKSHGVTGMDIGNLLSNGQFREIAEYCLRDVQATVQLYHVWRERLAGIK